MLRFACSLLLAGEWKVKPHRFSESGGFMSGILRLCSSGTCASGARLSCRPKARCSPLLAEWDRDQECADAIRDDDPQPLNTVVVPMHNAEAWTGETLETVANQSHQDWQIAVVDDGSTARSVLVVEELRRRFPDKVTAISQSQMGVSAARNAGWQEAKGEFIALLDADDLRHDEKLTK